MLGAKNAFPVAMRILRVALDVPLATLFDYALPEELEADVGDRVVVPLGARQRIGVVIEQAPRLEGRNMVMVVAPKS